jgi:hypothetical protein
MRLQFYTKLTGHTNRQKLVALAWYDFLTRLRSWFSLPVIQYLTSGARLNDNSQLAKLGNRFVEGFGLAARPDCHHLFTRSTAGRIAD